MSNFRYYNSEFWNNDYLQRVERCEDWSVKRYEFLLKYIPKGTSSILDLGCRNGGFERCLVEHGRINDLDRVLAVDLTTEGISDAQILNTSNKIEFKVDNIFTMELEEKFDLIIFSDSFMYFDHSGQQQEVDQRIVLYFLKLNNWLTDKSISGVLVYDIYKNSPWRMPESIRDYFQKFFDIIVYEDFSTHIVFIAKKE